MEDRRCLELRALEADDRLAALLAPLGELVVAAPPRNSGTSSHERHLNGADAAAPRD
jgi:hypothetical protein